MNRRRWAAAIAIAAVCAGATVPAAAQDVPYRFVGGWTQGGQAVAVLAYGRFYVTIRHTGPLDANYSVESVDDTHVTLVDTRGVRHRLGESLPGAHGATPPRAAPFVPAPPPVAPDPAEEETSG